MRIYTSIRFLGKNGKRGEDGRVGYKGERERYTGRKRERERGGRDAVREGRR